MDESRFAQSLQAFAGAFDRRDALRSLSAAGMALLAAVGFPDGGDAKKKRGNKKKKKKCKGGTKKCGKRCIPATNCCADGDCDGGTCVSGTCQCPSGSKACDGACIPEGHCCAESDCDDGNPCTRDICNGNGTCSHPKLPDLTVCGGKNCSGGVCATYPSCIEFGGCFSHRDCCSNFCIPQGPGGTFGECLPISNPGQPCYFSRSCNNSTCVGFICTQ